MAIKTPDILPGEEGYVSKKERTLQKKEKEEKAKEKARKKKMLLGKIKLSGKGLRLGKPAITPRKDKRYIIWRYGKKIGEILVDGKDQSEEKITLTFNRLGGIGNYKHLIQDADFQRRWIVREQELLLTQNNCYVCSKKLSKTAKPNLYHYNMWKFRSELLEKAEKIPEEAVLGKLTVEEAWEKFNDTLESGNRYFMSLKDTALICANCAKAKNVNY